MGKTSDALDEQLATEEMTPMTAEEKMWCEMTLQAVPEDQRKSFGSVFLDVLCIVRGFSGSKHRKDDTLKSVTSIAEWRAKVNYYNMFAAPLQNFDLFHNLWKENICGPDSYGHMVQVIRIEDLDVDGIEKMDLNQLEVLQGQKMKAYAVYKDDMARQRGVQRYKHTLLVDLSHVKLSMVSSSSKRSVIQHVFGIGSKYFPETIWKIYLVNGPMVFRAVFSMIKPLLAPETIAKIHMTGSYESSLKKMESDGLPRSALPTWIGGTAQPISTKDYINKLIMQRRPHSPQMQAMDRRNSQGLGGMTQQMQGMTLLQQ